METVIARKQTSFRLRTDLLERLKALAIRKNWSLNSCVEEILLDAVYHEPNTETVEASEEAKAGKSAGKLDVSSYDAFMNSINAIE